MQVKIGTIKALDRLYLSLCVIFILSISAMAAYKFVHDENELTFRYDVAHRNLSEAYAAQKVTPDTGNGNLSPEESRELHQIQISSAYGVGQTFCFSYYGTLLEKSEHCTRIWNFKKGNLYKAWGYTFLILAFSGIILFLFRKWFIWVFRSLLDSPRT